jgi:hypothetical protein
VVVRDVVFESPSGNTLWFLFPNGRRRRIPFKQIISTVGKHEQRQAIRITVDAANELRRHGIIDE